MVLNQVKYSEIYARQTKNMQVLEEAEGGNDAREAQRDARVIKRASSLSCNGASRPQKGTRQTQNMRGSKLEGHREEASKQGPYELPKPYHETGEDG